MNKKKKNSTHRQSSFPRIHREGRNIIVGLVLIIFIVNVIVYYLYTGLHWIFAASLIVSAVLLVFVSYFYLLKLHSNYQNEKGFV